ncbi:hypothetical protein ALT_1167 [Aspergillus lentulus]|uniref:Uncharacterized protein n=1 Tax=Aspergillus lentulus TaxID=293939 RepID=A0AAN4PD47_ASPLE|nr:hypothetical protein ALT_1167 [Aspergillus lentulus]
MGVVLTNATAQHPIRISGVTLLIPFDGDSLRPARPKAQIKFNTAGLEHIVTVWKCNSIIEELPQLAAQFHDLLETSLLSAATRPADTGDTIESAEKSDGNDAEAEVIQQHAEDTL